MNHQNFLFSHSHGPYEVHTFSELESTNSSAREWSADLGDRTVLLAKRQTKGRGRFERSWEMEPGKDLTFTLVLDQPHPSPDELPGLTQLMALSLIEVLEMYGIQASLKWPNDVWTSRGKIAGILCETLYSEGKIRLFCGMGVNVGSQSESLSKIDQKADSFANHGLNCTSEEVLHSWLTQFEEKLRLFGKKGLLPYQKILSEKLLFRHQKITLSALSKDHESGQVGKLIGISPKGRLLVDISGRGLCEFHSGEVRLNKPNGDYQ